MLIEFSVSNFRSFREKQTFSMVAASRLRKKENVFTPKVLGEKVPDLLKVAAIYGPNASGKSNLLKAIELVQYIAGREPSAKTSELPVSPFRFDAGLANSPAIIDIHFISREQRYEFSLAVTKDRILEERLTAYPRGKETFLYSRQHCDGRDDYVFGKALEGGEDLHEAWKRLTGPRVLFISQAVANSSEELKQLRPPCDWLQTGIYAISRDMEYWADASQSVASKMPLLATELSSFLREVDVPVTSIKFEKNSGVDRKKSNRLAELTNMQDPEEDIKRKSTYTHKTTLGEANFEYHEESEGTKNLIGFWLPWSLVEHDDGEHFRTLVVDELDSSLHPRIVADLIDKHLRNPRPAQLIFTTHDTHLMDTKLLRRDQFWLTERSMEGATQLRSIHEFEGREGEDVEKRYYEGRYRGLPILQKI